MRAMITTGGTGGHVFPAIALYETLLDRGHDVLMCLDGRGAAHTGVRVKHLRVVTSASPSGSLKKRLAAIPKLLGGVWKSWQIIADYKPDVVISFGSYAAVPCLVVAMMHGIPVILHEQNALLGKVNRLFARLARGLALTWESTQGIPDTALQKIMHTGNPVRADIIARRGEKPATEALHLLITGGSQGAKIFARVVPKALYLLPPPLRAQLHVTMQCREEQVEDLRTALHDMDIPHTVQAFFTDMADRLQQASLVIARAGASTLAELTVMGRPAILVPYPHAADNHQTITARALVSKGAAWVLEEDRFSADRLASLLEKILTKDGALRDAGRRSGQLGWPDAATRLADFVEHCLTQPAAVDDVLPQAMEEPL